MKKPQFTENQIYHIYNRGVEKRKIFMNNTDYFRFIHSLFVFNDEDAVKNVFFYFNAKSNQIEYKYLAKERKKRKLLVEILEFTLMPNHFHLLLREKEENGIVKFMQKLGTGYTMYFNKKHARVGGLFQGRFKAIIVNTDAYFLHLPFYIHANPLKLYYKKLTSTKAKTPLEFLEQYRWSSLPDYLGKKNFPSVTSRNFLLDFWGDKTKHRKELVDWIKNKEKNTKAIKDITFE